MIILKETKTKLNISEATDKEDALGNSDLWQANKIEYVMLMILLNRSTAWSVSSNTTPSS
jgi:hypothetical protein